MALSAASALPEPRTAHQTLAYLLGYSVASYLLMLIVIINWDVAVKAVTFDWAGQFHLTPRTERLGGRGYLPTYLAFMTLLCVFPYLEENIRCIRYALNSQRNPA